MGFHAKWISTCDHCGRQAIVELTPEQDSGSYFDLWGPGFPDGWLQSNEEGKYVLYCSRDCLKSWLCAHGRAAQADEVDNAVWVA